VEEEEAQLLVNILKAGSRGLFRRLPQRTTQKNILGCKSSPY